MVSSVFYQLRRIKFIRCSLPTSTAVQLVNSFIISRVDYCNSVLAGVSNQSHAGNTQLCSSTRIRSLPVRPRHRSHQIQIALATGSTSCPFQVCDACVQSATRHRSFIHRPILCQTNRRRAPLRAEIRGSFSTRPGCPGNENSVWRTLLHCRRSIDLQLFAGLRQGCRVVGYF